jgi:hypothetical protein
MPIYHLPRKKRLNGFKLMFAKNIYDVLLQPHYAFYIHAIII